MKKINNYSENTMTLRDAILSTINEEEIEVNTGLTTLERILLRSNPEWESIILGSIPTENIA